MSDTATLSLADLYSPIRDDLEAVQCIFDDELVSELPFVKDLCDNVRSFRGKMLRPALLLLTGKAVGDLTREHHVLAAVVEIVHMATLVHDDVLDESNERRGRPPVHSIAGNVAAVLLGDYLISHAFHLCSGLDDQHASRQIGATTNIVCEGELLQSYNRGNLGLTEETYLDIIRRKTGALTAVSCGLGARYAGVHESIVSEMSAYGTSAGVAFQIIDDVLDLVGDDTQVRKTLGKDLALGKLTLPTIHCLANASTGTAANLRAALTGAVPCDRERVRNWLEESGSVEYAINIATEYVADARRRLDRLSLSEARTALASLAEFIVQRQF